MRASAATVLAAALIGLCVSAPALAQTRPPQPMTLSAPPDDLPTRAAALTEAGDHAGAAAAWAEAARLHLSRGDGDAAAEAFRDAARAHLAGGDEEGAVTTLEAAARDLSALSDAGGAAGRALASVARIRTNQGRYVEALAVIDRAEALAGPASDPVDAAALLYDRARALDSLGRAAEAEAAARRALALRRQHLGETHAATVDTLNQLANSLQAQGRYEEADGVYRQVLGQYEALHGPNDHRVAIALSNLGNNLRRRGRSDAAEPLYRRAVEIAETSGDQELLAQCLTNLGWHLRVTGHPDLAEPIFRRASDLMVDIVGAEHPFAGIGFANLALSLSDREQYAEAEPLFTRAVAVLEPALGPDSPDMVVTLDGYAASLSALERTVEAESLYRRALDITLSRLAPGHADATRQSVSMAGFLLDQDRPGEALGVLDRAEVALDGRSDAEAAPAARRAADLFAAQVDALWALDHAAPQRP